MYKETLKRKPLRGLGTFLTIIILVFFVLALMLLVGWLQLVWNISYLQYILLGAVLVSLFFLLRRHTARYVYSISGDKILMYKEMGRKQKALFEFSVRDIIQFGSKYAMGSILGKRKRFFLFEYSENDAFFIALSRDIIILSPSGEFIQRLKEAYEKTDR